MTDPVSPTSVNRDGESIVTGPDGDWFQHGNPTPETDENNRTTPTCPTGHPRDPSPRTLRLLIETHRVNV